MNKWIICMALAASSCAFSAQAEIDCRRADNVELTLARLIDSVTIRASALICEPAQSEVCKLKDRWRLRYGAATGKWVIEKEPEVDAKCGTSLVALRKRLGNSLEADDAMRRTLDEVRSESARERRLRQAMERYR